MALAATSVLTFTASPAAAAEQVALEHSGPWQSTICSTPWYGDTWVQTFTPTADIVLTSARCTPPGRS